MDKMDNESEMVVALLHDVIEDSELTAQDLLSQGFPNYVVQSVVCLTKKDDEEYEDFIERVSTNALATKFKMADLEENLNVLRLKSLGDKELRRIAKYHKAWKRLSSKST